MKSSAGTTMNVNKIVSDFEAERANRPSNMFLWTSIGALSIALLLKFSRKKKLELFISQWATPFLLYIVSKKLANQLGKK
jgi:hypothetical protein